MEGDKLPSHAPQRRPAIMGCLDASPGAPWAFWVLAQGNLVLAPQDWVAEEEREWKEGEKEKKGDELYASPGARGTSGTQSWRPKIARAPALGLEFSENLLQMEWNVGK